MKPEHHFRKAEFCAVDGDTPLARKGYFQSAAEAKPVDDGNCRGLERFEPVDDIISAPDRLLNQCRVGRATKLIDVGAGDEIRWLR